MAVLTLAAAGALVLATSSQAQVASPPPSTPDHSQEAFVVEQMRTVYRFENDGTGRRETMGRIRVQSDAGVQTWGQLAFGYNAASERIDINYVRVRKADGSVVTAPASAVQDLTSPVQREAPVYTDYRQKHVTVPSLRPGETLEYSVATTIHTAMAPGHFWVEYGLERNVIMLDEQLEVNIPSGRAVILKTLPGADAKIADADGRRVYRWTNANTVRPDKDAETKQKDDDEPQRASVRLTTFQSWDEVGRWYAAIEKRSRTITPEIRGKAQELIAGRKTDIEKVEALYNYVAPNFRYVSLSLGTGRYQPRAAADVLRDQYGDCKDKHTLLAALLESVGLSASTVLINSAIEIDPDFPAPSQFDHAITRVPLTGQELWMDVTTEIAPFRLLSPNLRKKDALVVTANPPSRLVKTPADPPLPSELVQEIRGTLGEAGTLVAKVTLKVRGDVELWLRGAFRQTPAAMWKDAVKQMSESAGLGGEVSDWKVSDPAATADPFEISFEVKKVGFVDWTKKKVDMALPWAHISLPEPKTDSKKPLEIGERGRVAYTLRLELGAGYQPRVPVAVSVKRDYAEYSGAYSLDGRTFVAERTLQIRTSSVPPDRAGDVAAFTRVVTSDDKQKLGLEIAAAAAGVIPDLKAAELIRAGYEALGNDNYTQAITLLKRAVELEPKDKKAWNYLGQAYLGTRDHELAVATFGEQLKVNPYDEYAWNNIAHARMQQGRFTDAETAFRKQLEMNPLDTFAQRGLGSLLVETKRYAEAVPQLTKAITLASDDAALHVDLGTAHLNLSHDADALAAYAKAVELSPTPNTWNNIAYQLSLRGAHLDRALQYAESAVSSVAAASRNLTLEHISARELGVVHSLASYWDTLGWVYFAKGEPKRAEAFIGASWFLSQHAEVGDHLAQIYEKQGLKDQAIRTYAAALAGERPSPEIRTRLERIGGGAAKVDALARTHAQDLQAVRTFPVRSAGMLTGTAEVAILVDATAKAMDVRFIEGSEQLRPLVDAVRGLTLGPALPDTTAKVIRRGVVACAASGCSLTLVPSGLTRPVH